MSSTDSKISLQHLQGFAGAHLIPIWTIRVSAPSAPNLLMHKDEGTARGVQPQTQRQGANTHSIYQWI